MTEIIRNLKVFLSKLSAYQQQTSLLLIALLSLYLMFYLYQFISQFLPSSQQPNSMEQRVALSTISIPEFVQVNVEAVKKLNLFGEKGVTPVVEEADLKLDVPQTKLQLTLNGVVASNTEKGGAAIIEHRSQQST
jgi:general secretion pathway protein C